MPGVAQTKQGRFLTVAKKAPLFRPHRSKVGLFLVPCGGRGWARPLCASGSVLCVLKAACIAVRVRLVPLGVRGWARPLSASGSVKNVSWRPSPPSRPPVGGKPRPRLALMAPTASHPINCFPCFPSAAAARVVLGFLRFPIVRARAPVAEGCEDISGLGFVLARALHSLLFL